MNMMNVTLWGGLWFMIAAAWLIVALIMFSAWSLARGDWRRFCRQIILEEGELLVMAISIAMLVTVVGPMIMDLTIRGL